MAKLDLARHSSAELYGKPALNGKRLKSSIKSKVKEAVYITSNVIRNLGKTLFENLPQISLPTTTIGRNK